MSDRKDADLQQLREMFPTVDSEVRLMVLESNGNNLDPTIDSLLQITDGEARSSHSNNNNDHLSVHQNVAASSSSRSPSPSAMSASRDELEMYRAQVTSTPMDQLAQDEAFAHALAVAMQMEDEQDSKKWTNFFGNSSSKSTRNTKEGKTFTAKIDEFFNRNNKGSSGRSTPTGNRAKGDTAENLQAKWNSASSGTIYSYLHF